MKKDRNADLGDEVAPKVRRLVMRYEKLGVDVMAYVQSLDGEYVATGFACRECGCGWSPDAGRVRDRPRCPERGCNKGMAL